ncbi:hypothetical protein [Sphingomonas sp. 1P08PE]|uniref:hypothetical protein n=1 Tax=Sphingomonas sp. 1P08PE TaxID=554122 RepID=UPI00399EEA34
MRRLLLRRDLAVLLCVAALLLKLLVPTGYMITNDHGLPTITICPGVAPAPAAMVMHGMHGMATDHAASMGHGDKGGHRKADQADAPCAYAGLSAATLGAIDPVQLAGLLAFIAATGFRSVHPSAPLDASHLRPPPIGPPARD